MAESTKKRQRPTPRESVGAAAGLPLKQRKFVAEYLKDGNGTQAAIRAGYSARTAGIQAFELLRKPKIKALTDKHLEKVEITAERVLNELRDIAYANPLYVAEALKASLEMDPGPMGGELERHRGTSLRYEHKLKALELLGKHLKLFTEKVEVAFDGWTDEQLEARLKGIVDRIVTEEPES